MSGGVDYEAPGLAREVERIAREARDRSRAAEETVEAGPEEGSDPDFAREPISDADLALLEGGGTGEGGEADPEPGALGTRFARAYHVAVAGSDLPGSARRVAHILVSFADSRGGNAFPAVAAVADLVPVTTRTVERALRKLRDEGWLATCRTRQVALLAPLVPIPR